MKYFDKYIVLVFIVKICFIVLSVTHIYLRATGKSNTNINNTVVYWKERMEFIFIFLMSCLLIYLFNPRKDRIQMIDTQTQWLFYLFGFVLLITAKWNTFITQSKWFNYIQETI